MTIAEQQAEWLRRHEARRATYNRKAQGSANSSTPDRKPRGIVATLAHKMSFAWSKSAARFFSAR